MTPNRKGKVTEYKEGHYYLTHVEWEDGHCEIEIHLCVPQILWRSCDSKQLEQAIAKFQEITKTIPINENIVGLVPRKTKRTLII